MYKAGVSVIDFCILESFPIEYNSTIDSLLR